MADDAIHDLTAGYALDALDSHDEERYEEHLATCERCREELAELRDPVAALAYGATSPAPPPALRERILEAVHAERSNVVPIRRRLPAALGAVAAVAATVAIALGLWAASVSSELDRERTLLAILADPEATSIPLEGANGRVVVTDTGEAALIVSGLATAPPGKTYELWVAKNGEMLPAGVFDAKRERDVVRLTRPVPPGSGVAVTVEDDGGTDTPTGDPIFSAGI
ncbi:MAG: anti-sigma factor [Actinobacteria bacterium]|nr:anti-sigma factor [Actinomycetota bacterium]